MVTFSAPSRDRLLEGSRELYHQSLRIKQPQDAQSEVVNEREAATLDDPTYRVYRGRVYRIEPIPYKAGLKLQREIKAYGEATEANDADGQEAALTALVRLYARLAVPTGWRRLVARALPNPFRHASEKEIIALADFFWQCRTGQSLHRSVRTAAKRARQSTASTAQQSSRGSSPHGPNGDGGSPAPTGTPSAGGDTSTE